MIFASIVALIGLAMLLGGVALIAAHSFARDDDGYYTSDTEQLRTGSYAIASEEIDLGTDPADWAPDELFGTIRVRADGASGRPVFLGIGRDAEVDRYLAGVRHAQLTDFLGGEPRYDRQPGGAPQRPPGAEDFWVAQSQGSGERVVDWDAESGIWSVVVMNANGAPGVSVDADVGVKLDWVIWVGIGLAIVGLILTATAVVLILFVSRRAARDPAPAG